MQELTIPILMMGTASSCTVVQALGDLADPDNYSQNWLDASYCIDAPEVMPAASSLQIGTKAESSWLIRA